MKKLLIFLLLAAVTLSAIAVPATISDQADKPGPNFIRSFPDNSLTVLRIPVAK